jgi:hypothetical protein
MWTIDLKQMKQYYGTWVTSRGGHLREVRQKKETKNLNMVDIYYMRMNIEILNWLKSP